jgi:hypothetical protein
MARACGLKGFSRLLVRVARGQADALVRKLCGRIVGGTGSLPVIGRSSPTPRLMAHRGAPGLPWCSLAGSDPR